MSKEEAARKVATKWVDRTGEHAAAQQDHEGAAKGTSSASGKHESGGVLDTILGGIGTVFGVAIEIEKKISAPIAAIPFPGLPAATTSDGEIGVPHAHMHWPNLIPPSPVPIPLPSLGPILHIPWLSGAEAVTICGSAAARCGDLALSLWCGGWFPLTELFTGSASVWIEGCRAARLFDITKHCIFSVKKPSDPPLGLFAGAVASGRPSVLIGGAPMPSLTALALEAAMKGAAKAAQQLGMAGASAFRRVAARFARAESQEARILKRFLNHAEITGSKSFKKAVKKDLEKMVQTASGKELLGDLTNAGKKLEIKPSTPDIWRQFGGACAAPVDGNLAHARPNWNPNGSVLIDQGPWGKRAADLSPNVGTGSTVHYSPSDWPRPGSTTPSDVVLFHELTHAKNMAQGMGQGSVLSHDPTFGSRWLNMEEFNTVANENRYRGEIGQPPRGEYTQPLP